METYEHKLSLLVNADEALSPWSRLFFTSLMAQCCVLRLIFLTVLLVLPLNQPFFSSLEATGSTYFECISLLSLSLWMCCISW